MSRYAYRFLAKTPKTEQHKEIPWKMKTPTWINIEENNFAEVSNENSEEKMVMIAAGQSQSQYHF